MGLYLTVPGANYSAAAGKIGTLALASTDALPVVNIDGLTRWWSAEDADIAGTVISWLDRKNSVNPTPRQTSAMPAEDTAGGKPTIYFNTAGMNPGGGFLNQAEYHLMFVLYVPNLSTVGGLIGSHNVNLDGLRAQIFNDGSLRAANSGSTLTTIAAASSIGAAAFHVVEIAWDATNKFTAWVDGVQKNTGVGSASAPTSGVPTIGAIDQTVSNGFKGHIAEIASFSRNMTLSPGDLANLKWLRRRFGNQYGISITS